MLNIGISATLSALAAIKIPFVGKTRKSGLFVPDEDKTRERLSNMLLGGRFTHALRPAGDNTPDELLDWCTDRNLVTNVGLQHILDTEFESGAQSTTWYLGIFASNYTPTATDTAAILTSSYGQYTTISESVRPTWTSTRSGQTCSNSASKATFTANGGSYPDTIYGAFLVNSNTKTGTSGTLMAASQFSTSRTFAADADELIVQYDITATAS